MYLAATLVLQQNGQARLTVLLCALLTWRGGGSRIAHHDGLVSVRQGAASVAAISPVGMLLARVLGQR